jgi:hypothetical protein
MDSLDNLARRIRLGEDSELEPKRVLLADARVNAPERGEFADELAAFEVDCRGQGIGSSIELVGP